MSSITIPNTFSANTLAQSSQGNANFTAITAVVNGDIDNTNIATAAAIARSKLASGTADHVLINNGSGVMSSEAQLAVTRGGTGAASLTQYGVVLGNGTSAVNVASTSATAGVPLVSAGASANPAFGTAVVAGGGTGVTSNTAYAVLCGGTTSTGAIQSIAGVGTSGQVLTSNGAGALPTFQSAASTTVTTPSHTFTGFGTTSGDRFIATTNNKVYGFNAITTCGTSTAVTFSINLVGVTIDTTTMGASPVVVGFVHRSVSTIPGTSSGPWPIYYNGSTNDKLYVSRGYTSNAPDYMLGNDAFSSGNKAYFVVTGLVIT